MSPRRTPRRDRVAGRQGEAELLAGDHAEARRLTERAADIARAIYEPGDPSLVEIESRLGAQGSAAAS